jgi:protein-disulfide isomerase
MNSGPLIKKKPIQLWILNLVSLLGLTLSVYLTQHFYEVRNGTAAFKSICNVSERMNCDTVTASAYSELLPGFPIASFAAGFFLTLFIVSLIAHSKLWRREAVRAAFLLSILGTLSSLPYFLIMTFKLHTYCLFCLGVDGLCLAALITAATLKPEGISVHRPDPQKWKVLIGVGVASLLISVLGLRALDASTIPRPIIEKIATDVLNTPPVAVRTGEQFPSIGPKSAPITVVEFSDFQCPFCRMAALSLNSVLSRYGDKIRVEFRNFPLDQSCNTGMKFTPHPAACESAKAALCAYQQGKFEKAYETLFDRQSELVSKRPIEILKGIEMKSSQLESCMSSPETSALISKDIEEATQLGIASTPTFFINGHKAEGALPPTIWQFIIDKLLQ